MNLLPEGLWPVMITPFTTNTKIDIPALEELTLLYIQAECTGLFANCLSSEMFELNETERLTVIDTVVNASSGKVPVVATGTFGLNIEYNIEFIKKVFDSGVSAVIINSNQLIEKKDKEEQLKIQLEKIISATGDIPLGIYECPVPYKRLLSPKLMKWMADSNRFFYHKDTSCDLPSIEKKINAVKGSNLGFYNANMPTAIASIQKGAKGISPIGANFFPELYSYLFKNIHNKAIQDEVKHLNAILSVLDPFIHHNYPFSAKLFLQKRGFKMEQNTRTNFNPMESQDYIKLDDLYRIIKKLFKEYNIKSVI